MQLQQNHMEIVQCSAFSTPSQHQINNEVSRSCDCQFSHNQLLLFHNKNDRKNYSIQAGTFQLMWRHLMIIQVVMIYVWLYRFRTKLLLAHHSRHWNLTRHKFSYDVATPTMLLYWLQFSGAIENVVLIPVMCLPAW